MRPAKAALRIFSVFLPLLFGCGKNVFKEERNPAELAVTYLEQGEPDKAIDILLKSLGSNYKNMYTAAATATDKAAAQLALTVQLRKLDRNHIVDHPDLLVSILASAIAQKHGVDLLDLAFALASQNSEDTQSQSPSESPNTFGMLFPALPEASSANLKGVAFAITILNSLAEYKQKFDEYKLALFFTANVALMAKTLDTDHDNYISTLEMIELSDEVAELMVDQILSAALSAADSAETEESSSSPITEMAKKIAEQEGSAADKIQNLLTQ